MVSKMATIVFFGAFALAYFVPAVMLLATIAAGVACIALICNA